MIDDGCSRGSQCGRRVFRPFRLHKYAVKVAYQACRDGEKGYGSPTVQSTASR
ncbi:hypothetical protein ACVWWO_004661 [Bradyrhizobium sp. F1.13.1]